MTDRATSADSTFWSDADEREALEGYRSLVEAVDDGIYQLDAEGRFVAVNPAFVELTGYSRTELLGADVSFVLEESSAVKLEYEGTGPQGTASTANTGTEASSTNSGTKRSRDGSSETGTEREIGTENPVEATLQTADGRRLAIELQRAPSAAPVDGRTRTSAWIVRERTDSSESATEPGASVASVLDDAEVGVFVLDEDLEVVWINETTERYFEIEREDAIGSDKRRLIDETIRNRIDDDETFVDAVFATYDDNSYAERFECRVTPDGDREERWLEHRSKPIESGRYAGGRVELYYDVTEQHQRASQLRRLNEAVREWLEGTTRETVAERATRHLSEVLGLEINGVFLHDSSRGTLRPVAWTDPAEAVFGEIPTFAAGEGIAWRVFESGEAAIYRDVRSDPDIYNRETPIRSEIVLPIGDHGVVLAGSEERGAFDEGDLMLAKIAASSLEATFDRIRRERQLERERAQTEKLLETAPIAVSVENADGETVLANQRARDAPGLFEPAGSTTARSTPDRDRGRDQGQSIDTRTGECGIREDGIRPASRVRATGGPVFDEELLVERPRADSGSDAGSESPATSASSSPSWTESELEPERERRWFSVSAAPVFDADGELERIITVGEDVTALKARERELESELHEILGRVSDAFYALDEEFRFTHVNDRAEELLQHSAEDLLGESLWEVFPEAADEPAIRERFRTAMETQEPTSFERYFDPLEFWVEATIYPSETGASVYFRDVTERKTRERELELYERIVETVDDGVYAIDEDARFVLVNDAFCEMVGWEREELLGTQTTAIYDDEIAPRAAELAADVAAGKQDVAILELELHAKNGETVPVETRFGPFEFEDGSIGRTGVVRDVTERREYQRKLEESNERLEQFAYAASHDLQEPLRMVTSYLQLLERRYEDELDEDGREFIEFAVDGAERMRTMIDGLLEYARVESQGDPLEPVDLETVLADVRKDLEVQIAESDADIEIDTETLPRVRGDASQLRQLFQNLLSNALEYSGDEPPRVRVSAEQDESRSRWIVSVHDEGIGIGPDDQERIFEVFQRLHGRDEHEGTGIGLALCRRIVERHGGEIWVDSEPGGGATFSFTVPTARGDARE